MILKRLCGLPGGFNVRFKAERHFPGDPTLPGNYLPTGKTEPITGSLDHSTMRAAATGRDSTFGGWDGAVVAEWPDAGVRLIGGVRRGPSDLLHYWHPPDGDVWAFEQVIALPDAPNRCATWS